MDYISVKDAANKWGYSESTVRKWCREGIIKEEIQAEKKDGRWIIPSNAECPRKIK